MDVIEMKKAQYDACAKRILSHKIILAHVLKKCVKDFSDKEPKEIVGYIEDDPIIGAAIDQGFTNERIVGLNNEDVSINEGLVRFDIVFYVKVKDSQSKIIVNIEAQKQEPNRYSILNRAIFYVSRLISSQKERDFIGSNYDDIKQVYSIWICMNMNQNILSHYHLYKNDVLEPYDWKGDVDLLNIVLLGITNDIPDYTSEYDMHRLLGTLFSSKLNANEKISIIESEYDISFKDGLREEVNVMCNLGEGIEERAVERTTKEVTERVTKEVIENIAMNLYELGYTYAQISDVTKLDVDDIKTIIDQHCLN